MLTAIAIVIMAFVAKFIMMKIMDVGIRVTSGNRGDYLSIFATHCSIVFLTTSLMAVLSEKNKYVYWIDIVSSVLVVPKFFSFFALSVGAISTVLFAMIGFVVSAGEIIIGSFAVGLLLITILFRRMMSIYYQKDYHKEKIKEELVVIVKEKDYLDYLECIIQLKDITYLKAREREIEDIFNNLCLFEIVIEEYWRKNEREKSYVFHPIGEIELIYADLLSNLTLEYPQEICDYFRKNKSQNDIINNLRYLVYPIIANSFLEKRRTDSFFVFVNKWGKCTDQKFEIVDYLSRFAINNKDVYGEYLSKLFNLFDKQIVLKEETALYLDIINQIYYLDKDACEYILSYKNNREAIYMHLYKDELDKIDIRGYLIIAEGEGTNASNYFKDYICTLLGKEICIYRDGDETVKNSIEKKPIMCKVVSAMLEYRDDVDVKKLLEIIYSEIVDLDSMIYLNAGNEYKTLMDLEQWSYDYAIITNKKELEKHRDGDFKGKIDILQYYLEKLNYKGRRK